MKKSSKNENADAVTSVLTEEGNAKSSSDDPFTYWILRWSNYPKDWKEILEKCFCAMNVKFMMQRENTGDNPHIQGFVSFSPKKRFSTLKNEFPEQIHWERKSKNSTVKDCVSYCCKMETREDVDETPWCRGWRETMKEFVVKIDKFFWWEKFIIDSVLIKESDDRTIYWFWEEKGRVGKTHFQKWIYKHYDNVIVVGGKAKDMKYAVVKYKDDNGCVPNIVLINLARGSINKMDYKGMEEIKDMFFFCGKYETGMICDKNPHVIVFANYPPRTDRISADRWKVIHLEHANLEIYDKWEIADLREQDKIGSVFD